MFREARLPEHRVPPFHPRDNLPALVPPRLLPTPNNHSSLGSLLDAYKGNMIGCLLAPTNRRTRSTYNRMNFERAMQVVFNKFSEVLLVVNDARSYMNLHR